MILREEKAKKKKKSTEEKLLREVMVKIGLERIDTQEGISIEVLLDSRIIGLVMSSEFASENQKLIKEE